MIFIGQFEFVVDDKGRVNVPAKFRDQLPEDNKQLIILKGLDGRLVMYPESEIENLMEQFAGDHFLAAEGARRFQDQMLDGGSVEKPDGQGRVSLNAEQMSHAGLTKKKPVRFSGSFKHIHIWNPERHDEFVKPQGQVPNLEESASKHFGQQSKPESDS